MRLSDFSALTFDCYGTLIDWETGISEALAPWLERAGVRLERDRVLEAFAELGWELEPSRSNFLPNSVPAWPPFRETNAQLERFSKKFELGILSNIDDKLLGATRRHFRVDFDLVVTAQQVRSYKPDPAHFKECAPYRQAQAKLGPHRVGLSNRRGAVPQVEDPRDLGEPARRGSRGAQEAGRRGQDLPRRRQAAQGGMSRPSAA